MCVEGNQKKLHEGVQAIAQQHQPINVFVTHAQAHGRCEHRLVVYNQLTHWQQQWPGLARLVCVYRCSESKSKRYRHCHYYITDLCEDAQSLATLVRGHWTIENQLHWPKDVVRGEDKAPQRAGDSPANWSLVRNVFVN